MRGKWKNIKRKKNSNQEKNIYIEFFCLCSAISYELGWYIQGRERVESLVGVKRWGTCILKILSVGGLKILTIGEGIVRVQFALRFAQEETNELEETEMRGRMRACTCAFQPNKMAKQF